MHQTRHASNCDYHTDQYPWECTCGENSMSKEFDWADEVVDTICELDIEALSHEDWRIKFQGEVSAALRAAYKRGLKDAADLVRKRHSKTSSTYGPRQRGWMAIGFVESYGEIMDLVDELEKQA